MFGNTLLLAFRALKRNPMRSSLTMLGIVIGVAAVIAIVTLGRGASAQVQANVSSLGDRQLFVQPNGENNVQRGVTTRSFTARDVEAIRREVTGVDEVSPTAGGNVTAVYGNNHWSVNVTGITKGYFKVRGAALIRGEEFTEAHYQTGRLVCIIGKTVREELFGATDPVGATLRLGIASCPVVGELESKGQSGLGNDQDNVILAPLRAVQSRLTGNENIGSIGVAVAPWATNATVKEGIQGLLRARRGVGPQDADNFRVMDPAEIAGVLQNVTTILTLFLGSIAAVSLVVGGIGIMNIMLVSVTERTREIGIRLAIGALESEVLAQFLVEAVILTTVGGAIGVAIGLMGSFVASAAIGFKFVVDPAVIAGAFAFSAMIGLLFGFVPARRAARLDPIEALRHE
ncbi:MAG TPA: ABC transporter permease [Gammaproteobacteria bacterium]|nr:ABC transporter permease [Gammaproteobacteria bacterium]